MMELIKCTGISDDGDCQCELEVDVEEIDDGMICTIVRLQAAGI